MIDRPETGEKAILVQMAVEEGFNEALEEFKALAYSAEAEIVAIVTSSRFTPDAKYYLGKGKVEEVKQCVDNLQAEIVLINHHLSPSQQRNLETLLKCRVVDRSGLILDIFAQRARTFEGKLQVELAQLEHLSTRLIRGWTHLERQKGGIGLRGPGETQLETDRRLIRERIRFINQRLEKVRSTRYQNRLARIKADLSIVSLVGYTNAGKSSLFNALTHENIYVANQLFATLDPTMRKINLPGAKEVMLVDTVGFIQQLPHQLIEAFKATLEETTQANLLLHVIDCSDANWRSHVQAVDTVLEELGVKNIPVIQVFNKIDLKSNWLPKLDNSNNKLWISVKNAQGLDLLKHAIATKLQGIMIEEDLVVPQDQAKLRANLYQINAVLSERLTDEGNWLMTVRLTTAQKKRLLNTKNLSSSGEANDLDP